MRILLLGGTGFVGEYLAKRLSEKKDCEIIAVGNENISSEKDSDRLRQIQLDLKESSEELENQVNSADVAVIMTQPDEKIIKNLIAAIKPDTQLKKIVYLSTALLYDNFPGPQKEDSPLNPITDYEKGKYQEEEELKQFINHSSIKLCIPRLSNVYGDTKNRGLLNYIFLALINNGKFTINGKGDSVRDYIFVEDVATWIDFLIFWEQKSKIAVFNLCTGQGYSISQTVEEVEKVTGQKISQDHGPAVVEKKTIVGDNQKIRELSKISPKYDFVSGLEKTYQNYLSAK